MAVDSPPEGPSQRGLSKSTVTAVTAAGVGATGSYAIFTIAHLDEIFSRGAENDAGKFYALACFAALGLVAVFMNTQVKDSPQEKFPPITMIITAVFGVYLLAAIAILGYKAWTAPDMCNGAPCVVKTTLNTEFQGSADVVGYTFPQEVYPDSPRAALKASINADGALHYFEKDGKVSLSLVGGEKTVTVAVENLKILENAFEMVRARYDGLLGKEDKFSEACKSQLHVTELSGDCRDQFVAIVSSIVRGGER